MKKTILFIFLLLSMRGYSEKECCIERPSVYAKVFGAANFLQETSISGNRASYEPGYMFSGSLGYCWLYGLHWEAEYAFRRNSINNISFFGMGSSQHGHFQTSSYMANLVWHLPLFSWGCPCLSPRPLIGVGIGYDVEQMRASNARVVFNQKWHPFAWQLMVGLTYPIYCHTEISLEYKFHQGGTPFFNHTLGVALAYKFGLN